jgi:hypothetical protein
MDEVTKYTKLWDLPQGYGNNYDDPRMIEIVGTLTKEMGLHTFTSVLDVGGGDGRLKKFFPNHVYKSMDIAPNSGADIIGDVSFMSTWNEESFDWVISIDVMEHLPIERVDNALHNIATVATEGAAFLICTRPDRGGKKIGAVLHMTVRPPRWWVYRMEDYWKDVQLLRVMTGEYCLIVCRHAN